MVVIHSDRRGDGLSLLDTTLDDTLVLCRLGLMMVIALTMTHIGTNVLVALIVSIVVIGCMCHGHSLIRRASSSCRGKPATCENRVLPKFD